MLATIREVSRTHSKKSIALVGLDKCFDRCGTGVRALNEWYMGTPTRIHGLLLRNGHPVDQATLVEKARKIAPPAALSDQTFG